jgi:hypothetical protein
METYFQTDELQDFIDWDSIMPMSRYAGGHDEQMKGLFKNATVIAHYNENDWQGQVATCVKFNSGKYKSQYAIYTDYYGSCSGCDAWEDASDSDVKRLCIDLSNGAYIFKTLKDVKDFLENKNGQIEKWSKWFNVSKMLLKNINSKTIE